jgi:hypothetical protein
MTTKTSTETTKTAETFPGICTFCKGAFPKKSMTQHLKTCPERAPLLKADKTVPAAQKTRIFQILVEGRYDPEYWMQIEVPAVEDLHTLDVFLRRTWVECCDHLSGFKIGDTNYSSDPPFGDWSFESPDVEEEATDAEEEEDIVVAEDGTINMEKALTYPPDSFYTSLFDDIPESLLNELKAISTVDELAAFCHARIKLLRKQSVHLPRERERVDEARLEYSRIQAQSMLLEDLLEWEDTSFDVQLARVLQTTKKFTYDYDYGSTTRLQLKVLSMRDGVVKKQGRQSVQILARNIAPVMPCVICQQPASFIEMGFGFFNAESIYCKKCAKKKFSGFDELLPIVNSPRVGVCGYTGGD